MLKEQRRKMSDRKTASFDEFKAYTIAVVRGEQAVDPTQPKIWVQPTASGENSPIGNPPREHLGKLDS